MTASSLTVPRPSARAAPGRRSRTALWAAGVAALCVVAGTAAGAMPLAVAGAVGVAACVTAFARWPMYVLYAILLVRASIAVPGNVGPIGWAIVAGGGLALVLAQRRLPATRVAAPFLGLLIVGLVSVSYAPDAGEALRTMLRLAALFILFVVAALSVRTSLDFRRLVAVVLLSSVVPIGFGVWQIVTGTLTERQGVLAAVGTFEFANGYALYLLLIIALGLVALFEVRSPTARVVLAGGLALALLCFGFTFARVGWIGLVIVLGLLAILQYRRLIAAAVLIGIVAAVAVPSSVGIIQERFSDLSESSPRFSENSLSWRLENWERMVPYGVERPVLGNGLASFQPLVVGEFGALAGAFVEKAEEGPPRYLGASAHNDFVKLFVELGLAGPLLWLTALVGLATLLHRARSIPELRGYATALFAFAVALIPMSVGDSQQDYVEVMYYVMAVCGGLLGAAHHLGGEGDSAGASGPVG